jgi:hypothetical protein
MIPRVPPTFHLERIVLVPVGEAVRVGEGPYDARYAEPSYYFREYRKKYKNDVLARYAATALLFQLSKPTWLRYVQMSADLCNIDALAVHDWPRLDTLVLTGHSPRGTAGIVDIVARMPQLTELRLLFSKTKMDQGFRVLSNHHSTAKNSPTVLAQLKYLALSNACNFDGVLHYATSLERLAVCAIIDQPRVPIALSRTEIDKMLEDMEIGQRSAESKLLRLRIMIEDKVNPALCHAIALRCPQLQALEIELCGYHDGKSIHAWVSLSPLFLPRCQIYVAYIRVHCDRPNSSPPSPLCKTCATSGFASSSPNLTKQTNASCGVVHAESVLCIWPPTFARSSVWASSIGSVQGHTDLRIHGLSLVWRGMKERARMGRWSCASWAHRGTRFLRCGSPRPLVSKDLAGVCMAALI